MGFGGGMLPLAATRMDGMIPNGILEIFRGA